MTKIYLLQTTFFCGLDKIFYRSSNVLRKEKLLKYKNIAETYKILCTTKKTSFIVSLFPRQKR